MTLSEISGTMTGMRAGTRVAVFEDDAELQQLLDIVLRAEGFEALVDGSGGNAHGVASGFRPDLAIVDVTLGDGITGFDVARDLHAVDPAMPVMFLTGADSLEQRLEGFEAGADDYVVKPFALPELIARIHALLRRAGRSGTAVAEFADLVVDDDAHAVSRGGATVELTATEFSLLSVFMRRPRVVIAKAALLNEVWGFNGYDPNLVEVHMSSLRRKLEAHGPRLIHTVRSVGYVMRDVLVSAS